MTFLHEDKGYPGVIEDVSVRLDIPPGQIEKDYWITHVLWALHAAGLAVWFKGGTCLSKGYGIIQRFSEDLDLKLESGTMAGLPPTPNWKGEKDSHIRRRSEWFNAVAEQLVIPGCKLAINPEMEDNRARSIVYDVAYPGRFIADLGPVIRPHVRLEVGSARVTPFLERRITSWVHDFAEAAGAMPDFTNNRPIVRCIHPQVTLIEKLDAMMRRWERADLGASAFARHYEDAAQVIRALPSLPPVEGGLSTLVDEMMAGRQIRALPSADHPAFTLDPGPRTAELREAYEAIRGMFWGPRIPLDEACAGIRSWIAANLPASGTGRSTP